ncbi:MAG: hypothetical protein NTX28_06945 [Novosphingobium sp.]|nr:hypothetical protein [Novosphingobium sp.]
MTVPISDGELIALAQQLPNQVEREGATIDDYRELRGVLPAFLQRLREKVEAMRDLMANGRVDLGDRVRANV